MIHERKFCMDKQIILNCDACHYTFASDTVVDRCPDCGKHTVRSATEKEKQDYIRIQQEIEAEETE